MSLEEEIKKIEETGLLNDSNIIMRSKKLDIKILTELKEILSHIEENTRNIQNTLEGISIKLE